MNNKDFLEIFEDEDIKTSSKLLTEALKEEISVINHESNNRLHAVKNLLNMTPKEGINSVFYTDINKDIFTQNIFNQVVYIGFTKKGHLIGLHVEEQPDLDFDLNEWVDDQLSKFTAIKFPMIPLLLQDLNITAKLRIKNQVMTKDLLYKWTNKETNITYGFDPYVLKTAIETLGNDKITVYTTDELLDGILFQNDNGIAIVPPISFEISR